MVKPALRTKSIGFKVSEEEHAQLDAAAQTSGRSLGEWCREVLLARVNGQELGAERLHCWRHACPPAWPGYRRSSCFEWSSAGAVLVEL